MIINQLHSIGDILFLEPMFRFFMKERHEKPIVPLRDHLMWLQHYIDSATFVRLSDHPELQTDTMEHSDDFINTRYANQILRGYGQHDHHDFENMMPDKYRLVGLDPDMWQDIKLNFDQRRGMALMGELNDLPKDSPISNGQYILINEISQAGTISIEPKTDLKTCRMHTRSMYSVIDWYFMMLEAEENHHISTCTFYIMQAIKNKFPFWNSKVVLYPRPNEDGVRGISQLKTTFKYKIAS